MSVAIYTLTSPLHDESAVAGVTREFLSTLDCTYDFCGPNYAGFGSSHDLDLIYVRTGGTEGLFKELLPKLGGGPFYLLTSGKSNSLAASMEILSFLRQQGLKGEILHGDAEYVNARIALLHQVASARRKMRGTRLGIIGKPSDWLISSGYDPVTVRQKLGVELVSIPMEEVLEALEPSTLADAAIACGTPVYESGQNVQDAFPGAWSLYKALRKVVERYELKGFTIRCFDLLTAVKNTGCIALARLNAEGYVAGCEGDVPAMLSMYIGRSLLGVSGFQANPSRIDPKTGEILFAHCTVPFDMVSRYAFDTHFESGIGVGVRGHVPEGPVTVFKVSGDLSRHFAAEGELLRNQSKPDLCRTQVVLQLPETAYFLTNPIGNHHIILPGHCRSLLEALVE